jgi:hypothetical protein
MRLALTPQYAYRIVTVFLIAETTERALRGALYFMVVPPSEQPALREFNAAQRASQPAWLLIKPTGINL